MGCTDPSATNYAALAIVDDGSCVCADHPVDVTPCNNQPGSTNPPTSAAQDGGPPPTAPPSVAGADGTDTSASGASGASGDDGSGMATAGLIIVIVVLVVVAMAIGAVLFKKRQDAGGGGGLPVAIGTKHTRPPANAFENPVYVSPHAPANRGDSVRSLVLDSSGTFRPGVSAIPDNGIGEHAI